MHDESALIGLARQKSRKAFTRLYELHVESLFRFLHKFSSNDIELEEWVQRAFIKAFRSIDSFDGRSRFGSWLFRIAINEMKSDRRRLRQLEEMPEELAGESNIDDDFAWRSTMDVLLNELSEQKRMVFILFEVEGYSHAEIAAMLEIHEGTSRSLLMRAKQELKKKWTAEVQ
ncbi:MAG: RNA polymerase sigma factor [Ignavibacteriae bacterium]|nr:RNA polymerase sigma factor [Ignavibacteriota bacterium]